MGLKNSFFYFLTAERVYFQEEEDVMYKVVIVDDEPIIVEGLKRIVHWEKWGCIVAGTAGSGEEGIEVIEREKPDILITDICMPQMDGLAMIAALKSQNPQMEISILTGFREFDYAQQAIRLGVRRFLLKPSKMEEIEEAVKIMTEKHREYLEKHAGNSSYEEEEEDREEWKKDETAAVVEEGAAYENEASSFIVNNALEYIRNHYTEKLKLAEVAESVYVSQWHLSKLLNHHMGQSFSEILNNIRIDKAKELLAEPSLRIGDIAEEVGFLDMAHFSRVFKKQTGISANEFRNTRIKKK